MRGPREGRAESQGSRPERVYGSPVPRADAGSEAPPPPRAPPRGPFPLLIVLRQSGRGPRPAPQV